MMKNRKVIISLIISIFIMIGLSLSLILNKHELKDGIYKAYGDSYIENGYKPFVVIEVKNGRMIDSLLEYISEEGKLLTKDRLLKHDYLEKTGNSPESFTKEIRVELLIKQGTSTLDKSSSDKNAVNTFKKIIDELIEQRIKTGNEEVLTVGL